MGEGRCDTLITSSALQHDHMTVMLRCEMILRASSQFRDYIDVYCYFDAEMLMLSTQESINDV